MPLVHFINYECDTVRSLYGLIGLIILVLGVDFNVLTSHCDTF